VSSLRSKLVTAVAVGAAAISATAIATAATSGSSSSSSSTATGQQSQSSTRPPGPPSGAPVQHDPSKGGHTVNGKTETLLSGDTAEKVKAAALAKVAGTVERAETNVDGSAPYKAHIRKSDGTEVEVQVNSDYTVAAVNTMGAMGAHP
jgi:uncharacterized membrane protein YkoI